MTNETAVEKLDELIFVNTTIDETTLTEIHDFKAILAAIQSDPMAYVKPKPLEWEHAVQVISARSSSVLLALLYSPLLQWLTPVGICVHVQPIIGV